MKSTSICRAIMAGGFALAMTAGQAFAGEVVKIAAEEPGGGWYSYSATFAKLIDANKDAGLTAEIIPRGGGFANPTSVDRNIAQFGFTTSNAAAWAKSGLEAVYKGKKAENIRTVTGAMQAAYTIVMARKAYVDKTGYKTLEEMLNAPKLPKMGMEPTGSQVPMLADMIFHSMGTSLAELRDKGAIVQASSGQLSDMVTDGRIDLYFENVPSGQATVTETTLTNDMYYVPLPDKVLSALAQAGLPTGIMPKGTYRLQDADYKTALSATIFITNKDVDDDAVYNVLKTLVDNQGYIEEQHAALRYWDPKAGCQPENAVLPLHPGAEKLCKELGYLN